MPRIDLHTHTTASDGSLSPEELVHAALDANLTVMAITDHDTVAAVPPALAAAAGTGLTIVPGIEISAHHQGHSLHLLGYGFDVQSRTLESTLRAAAEDRRTRAQAMIALLDALGAPISWERVLELSHGTITRPHIARALVEAGHAQDTRDAFTRYIAEGRPAYVPSTTFSPEAAISLIRDAGGEVALAHAVLLSEALQLEAVLEVLCKAGLTGLEVYHPAHDDPAIARLEALARRRHLWSCGGSDFHGSGKPQLGFGAATVPSEVLEHGPFPRILRKAQAPLESSTVAYD